MQIVRPAPKNTVPFRSIGQGCVFQVGSTVCIKTSCLALPFWNSVDLETGSRNTLNQDDEVIPLVAHLVVES